MKESKFPWYNLLGLYFRTSNFIRIKSTNGFIDNNPLFGFDGGGQQYDLDYWTMIEIQNNKILLAGKEL